MAGIKPLKEVQKEHALRVLRSTKGDLAKAARILGLSLAELKRKMREWERPPD